MQGNHGGVSKEGQYNDVMNTDRALEGEIHQINANNSYFNDDHIEDIHTARRPGNESTIVREEQHDNDKHYADDQNAQIS